MHIIEMAWALFFHDDFEPEFNALPGAVADELLAHANYWRTSARNWPRVDTLNGSRHSNMKELRFDAAGGVWRVAFAFDPKRRAISWWRATRPA